MIPNKFNLDNLFNQTTFYPFPDRSFHNKNNSMNLDLDQISSYVPTTWNFMNSDTYENYKVNLKKFDKNWYYIDNEVKYTLNSFGYRTKEFEQIDWKNSIVMFGCSFIFGCGVNDNHTIPHFLEEITGTPVVNLGVSGSSVELQLYNSLILFNYYPKPKTVIYSWPSLTRNTVYLPDSVMHCGEWSEKYSAQQKFNYIFSNSVYMNVIRGLWKDRTKMIEYSVSISSEMLDIFYADQTKFDTIIPIKKIEPIIQLYPGSTPYEIDNSETLKKFKNLNKNKFARDICHFNRHGNKKFAEVISTYLT